MKALENFRLGSKILATILICVEPLYFSVVHPSFFDFISGAVTGLVIYCLWFNRDRNVQS